MLDLREHHVRPSPDGSRDAETFTAVKFSPRGEIGGSSGRERTPSLVRDFEDPEEVIFGSEDHETTGWSNDMELQEVYD